MSHGGKREGSGRRAGTFSKKRRAFTDQVAAEGITPLDYMLTVLRDEAADEAVRLDAAKAAAPYIHSKMPTALVIPPRPPTDLGKDDEELLNLYTSGIHAEADES